MAEKNGKRKKEIDYLMKHLESSMRKQKVEN